MHYYKRNIGDYHKKAGRLSILEHGAYTLLIDACYDREKFPTLDDAIDWAWARTDEEIAAVKFVLAKFFMLEDGLYIQTRILEEITIYHKNAAINKRIAIDREQSKSTKRERSVNEPPPNQEPLTTNQEPIKEKKRASPFAPPSISEVQQYITDNSLTISASGFIDYYESNGWMVGKNKMKNWQATCRTWEKRNETNQPDTRSRAKKFSDKLDEIARKSVEENGFTERVG